MSTFFEIIESFDANAWSWIIRGFIIIVPIYFSLRNYYLYRIQEYLIFGIYWLISGIGSILYPFFLYYDNTPVWQIFESSIIWAFHFLFLHSLRLKWLESEFRYKFFVYLSLIVCTSFQIMILLWKPIESNRSDFFLWSESVSPFYEGTEIGLEIDGQIIYSSGHSFLRDLYVLFVTLIWLYSYLTLKPVNSTPRIKRAHQLWKIGILITFVNFLLLTFGWRLDNDLFYLSAFFALSSLLLIAGITIFYPESFIISKAQIARINELIPLINRVCRIQSSLSVARMNILDYLEEIKEDYEKLQRNEIERD